jgi:IMP dehydrogenase/GMP reductase
MFKKLKVTYAYNDVSLVPAYSDLKSRSEADPQMHGYKLPIIASCMDKLGRNLMEEIIQSNIPFIAHRSFKSAKEQYEYFIPNFEKTQPFGRYDKIWFAVGSVQKYRDWIDYLYFGVGVRKFCVDMAHGDSKACVDTIKYIKSLRSNNDLTNKTIELTDKYFKSVPKPTANDQTHVIAGNVASVEGFKRLQKAGADGVRVGIASGSICSTALETGMGVPILTNIMEIAPHKKNTWLIADGGCNHTGDIAKAIYFGADFVMMGKMLAATDLAEGICYNKFQEAIDKNSVIYPQDNIELILKNQMDLDIKAGYITQEDLNNLENTKENILTWGNKPKYINLYKAIHNIVKYKAYNGMASREARSGLLNYASVEGRSGLIEYDCSTKQFIHDTYLRLQASLSYGGARNWKEFCKKVKVVRRSQAAISAGKTHLDVLFDK